MGVCIYICIYWYQLIIKRQFCQNRQKLKVLLLTKRETEMCPVWVDWQFFTWTGSSFLRCRKLNRNSRIRNWCKRTKEAETRTRVQHKKIKEARNIKRSTWKNKGGSHWQSWEMSGMEQAGKKGGQRQTGMSLGKTANKTHIKRVTEHGREDRACWNRENTHTETGAGDNRVRITPLYLGVLPA